MNKETKTKLRDMLRKLFALMGSDNVNESNAAKSKIDALLKKYQLTWNDAMEIIGATADAGPDASLLFDMLMRGHRKQADELYEIAQAAEFFRTKDDTVCADISVDGHRETWPLHSNGFERWLRRCYRAKFKNACNSESLKTAILEIEANSDKAPRRELFLRVGTHEGIVYLDLGDDAWTTVAIDPTGWCVLGAPPPVRFTRGPGMLPLPLPEKGGSLEQLRKLLRGGDDDFIIVVAWLLAALRGRPPYPVLTLSGPPGAAKSTMEALLRDIIDPNAAEPGGLPKDNHALAIGVRSRFVQAWDNISGITAEIADAICRTSTGGGYIVRAFFRDDVEKIFTGTRPVIIAGVEDVAGRHDLARRTLAITLERISDAQRRKGEAMKAEFAAAWPLVLGRLLDIVSHGLRELPTTTVENPSSMPDFDHWIAACETAEWPAGTFARAYAANKESLAAASLEADTVATLIVEMLDGGFGWTGTAQELLEKINSKATEQQKRGKRWPRTPHAMASRLRRASEVLRAKGWGVEHSRSPDKKGTRIITIVPTQTPHEDGTQSSETSERQKYNGNSDLGSGDVSDDPPSDDPRRPAGRTSSESKELIMQAFERSDISDDVLPTPSERPCAYCGESHPPPRTCSWDGEVLPLHADCEEYWAREHESYRDNESWKKT
jgi:hypothetical protein